MNSIKYFILEDKVFENKRGGFSHIINVALVLGKNFKIEIVGRNCSEGIPQIDSSFYKGKLALFRMYLHMLCDNKSIFLIRKHLPSLPVLFVIISIKKITRSNQSFFIEVNGVSGDYVVNNKLKKFILKLSNILLLKVYDGIYVVNESLKRRLSLFGFLNTDKIFVCLNGGTSSPYSLIETNTDSKIVKRINLIYFGDNQYHYHIDKIIEALRNSQEHERHFRIYIVGGGYNKTYPSFVSLCGRMKLYELFNFCSKLEGYNFGLIPLNNILSEGNDDICPIKYYDYLYCGLPVIASSNSLGSVKNRNHILTYDQQSDNSLNSIFSLLASIDNKLYTSMRNSSIMESKLFSWENTLLPLVERIRNLGGK